MANATSTRTPSALTITDLEITADEPRVKDVRVGERLGFDRPRDIRQLIDRNREELEAYGPLAARHRKSRGQEFTEYWLNEGQTLLLCMFSRTPAAAGMIVLDGNAVYYDATDYDLRPGDKALVLLGRRVLAEEIAEPRDVPDSPHHQRRAWVHYESGLYDWDANERAEARVLGRVIAIRPIGRKAG